MNFLIKFHSFWKFHILLTTKRCESLMYASTKMKESITTSKDVTQSRKKSKLYMPNLEEIKLEGLNNFNCISLVVNNVGWTRISISQGSLLEWGSFQLPVNFQNQMNEVEILKLVDVINQAIPQSDLYILETQKKWKSTDNDVCLRTTLIANLYKEGKGLGINDRVVIQNNVILNVLYDLTVGWERKSAKEIIKKIFYNSNTVKCTDDVSDFNCPINVSEAQKLYFAKSNRIRQESLSVALLMALSFMNVAVLKHSESHAKLMNRLKVKL